MTSDLSGFYQWMKKTPVTTASWPGAAGWTGDSNDPDYGDPCPQGFHTPSSGDLSALTLADIATLGLTMNGGLRFSSGSLFDSGTSGYYWSSSGSFLYFNSGFKYVYANNPAYGFSVRCLQD